MIDNEDEKQCDKIETACAKIVPVVAETLTSRMPISANRKVVDDEKLEKTPWKCKSNFFPPAKYRSIQAFVAKGLDDRYP